MWVSQKLCTRVKKSPQMPSGLQPRGYGKCCSQGRVCLAESASTLLSRARMSSVLTSFSSRLNFCPDL